MKAALYLRVSTKEQNTDNQKAELLAWCKTIGIKVSSIYVEHGSGMDYNRPNRQSLINSVRKGKYDAVVCWALDRWGRSASDILLTLDEFTSKGIRFMTMKDGLDTGTAAGRLVAGVLGALAEFERERILERQRAGIDRARAEGKILGREKRHIDEVLLMELRKEGHSIRSIAEIMKAPRSTVADRIKELSEKAPPKME